MNLSTVKRVVKKTLSSPPGWRLFGPLVRAPGVIVLTYHRIVGADRSLAGLPVEMFAAQMRWLRDNCEPIGPESLVEHARRPRRARPSVLVTFDDGYRDYHDLAYPVLEQLRIPAVVFLATSFMDQGGMMWTDQVQWASLSTRRPEVRLPWAESTPIPLPDDRARAALGETARAHMKKLPDPERLALLPRVLDALGEAPPRPRQMLNWDEVRAASTWTRWGGHSHTHPILSRLDRAVAEREIGTCHQRIKAETGVAPTTFAYPNGRPSDYTAETQAVLKQFGFELGFTTTEGIAGADTNWMAIKRLPGESTDLAEFAWLATGRQR